MTQWHTNSCRGISSVQHPHVRPSAILKADQEKGTAEVLLIEPTTTVFQLVCPEINEFCVILKTGVWLRPW